MSDTSFSAINRPIIPIGIIDETWASDTLSDDGNHFCHVQLGVSNIFSEIDMPKEIDCIAADPEEEVDDNSSDAGSEDAWNDNGMDMFQDN
jgi:hypothetical protein